MEEIQGEKNQGFHSPREENEEKYYPKKLHHLEAMEKQNDRLR